MVLIKSFTGLRAEGQDVMELCMPQTETTGEETQIHSYGRVCVSWIKTPSEELITLLIQIQVFAYQSLYFRRGFFSLYWYQKEREVVK